MLLTDTNVQGHVVIRDKDTGEVLVDKCNAVHSGNLSAVIVKALSSDPAGHIRYIAFGNYGTTISGSTIEYAPTNTGTIRDEFDALHNETFYKELDNSIGNTAVSILGSTNYSDIKVTATLDFIEKNLSQESIDRSDNIDGVAVFDELALYAGLPGISDDRLADSDAIMITHVVFNPIQKSANRSIEIDYTLRIQVN